MIALDSVMAALVERVETVAQMVLAQSHPLAKLEEATALAKHAITLCAELRERAERPADCRRGAA
jgi:hypothetical protein